MLSNKFTFYALWDQVSRQQEYLIYMDWVKYLLVIELCVDLNPTLPKGYSILVKTCLEGLIWLPPDHR